MLRTHWSICWQDYKVTKQSPSELQGCLKEAEKQGGALCPLRACGLPVVSKSPRIRMSPHCLYSLEVDGADSDLPHIGAWFNCSGKWLVSSVEQKKKKSTVHTYVCVCLCVCVEWRGWKSDSYWTFLVIIQWQM